MPTSASQQLNGIIHDEPRLTEAFHLLHFSCHRCQALSDTPLISLVMSFEAWRLYNEDPRREAIDTTYTHSATSGALPFDVKKRNALPINAERAWLRRASFLAIC